MWTRHRISLGLLGLSCFLLLSMVNGVAALLAVPTLLALLVTGRLVQTHSPWLQTFGHALFICLALALALHWLPGFEGIRLIDSAVFSEGALPYTLQLNLDKPLIGLWLALACPWVLVVRHRGLPASLLLILPVTLLACLGSAWALDRIAWAPKWPEGAWLWLLNNLLLVSLTEELLFRGYLQGGLQRLSGRPTLALWASAALFGMAHLGGGWQWACLAGTAGLGYGLAYRQGGLLAAVLCHFGLNLVHFVAFSYPALRLPEPCL